LKTRLPTEPALIGREQQFEQLSQHLDSAFSGHGTTVFIGGEAGVGKTRLVTEFLNLAKKKATRVLCGWCLSEAVVPYFPFTEAFNAYLSTINDAKMKTVMIKHLGITGWLRGPEVARESKGREAFSTPEIERDRTFEAAARALLQLSAQESTILFLDDLHWADHLSLALLHYIARKCRNSRLFIIGTYRSEELIRSKEEKLHPLEETMFSMSREDLLTKMELNRLTRDDFPKLLTSIFHSAFDGEFVEKLYRETEGNPLFVLETLNLLAEEGFLSERGGQWMLTAPTEKIGVPSKVHEVIIRRISRLDREERKLLDLAAVCGNSFNPDALRRTMALDLADVLEKLVDIEQKHKLIRSIDSTFEFTHQKIREVLYENLQAELRRIYHLKTAGCLEQVLAEKVSDGYLADIAFHYVEGGAPEKAFEYLVRLGEKAVDIYAGAQAIEYLNKALEATQKTASLATNGNLFKICKLRGRAWLIQDETTKAINDFNLILKSATNIGDESMIAEAHFYLGLAHIAIEEFNPYFSFTGFCSRVMPHLTKALEMARKTSNKLLEGKILARIGSAFIATVDTMDEGRLRLEESLLMCRETGDKINEANSLTNLAMYCNWKGEFSLAKEDIKRAFAIEEEVGLTPRIIGKLWYMSIILAGKGEYNDAISTGQRCLQLASEYPDVIVASWMLNTLGWIYHDLLSIELASKYNNESLELARSGQSGGANALGGVPHALANLANDCLYKDDHRNAGKYFEEASSLMHLHPSGWWRMETRILLGRGEIALANTDYAQALKFAEDSLAISEKADAKKYIAKGLKLKAEVLAKMGSTEEAIRLMGNALKLAQQVGNPPILWQTHHSFGLLFEKRGNLREANEHYAESITLIETTASKLNDASLKNSLLTATQTNAIRDAYARTKPST
jgi:tetratricopeptide (TPR) repeat protein